MQNAPYLAGARSEFRLVWRRRHNGAAQSLDRPSISPVAKRLVESRDFASDIPSAATDSPVATSVKSRKASPRYEHDWRRWRTAILARRGR
jgi:hypothetical protein